MDFKETQDFNPDNEEVEKDDYDSENENDEDYIEDEWGSIQDDKDDDDDDDDIRNDVPRIRKSASARAESTEDEWSQISDDE
ncbi:uncharacterized protein LODBEIA_P14860 [Lodderomyces beijingensis]|uniref:Uncharacterized protein n=1 Tax=Lodderomyces beijingensis TaxID=1775926 RepID=A0ABP0ZM38_9ASCO